MFIIQTAHARYAYVKGWTAATIRPLRIHTHHAASITRVRFQSCPFQSVALRFHMVLYSTVKARCFFSAGALRERLDEGPRPCWQDEDAAPPSLSSGSSLG